mmetsp:Transcript_17159/g.47189  ORF Transcript_17159/g.47189 Transcript_17159/m.47189 type:complete len:160 (+) Transcript_17159:197-676(+)
MESPIPSSTRPTMKESTPAWITHRNNMLKRGTEPNNNNETKTKTKTKKPMPFTPAAYLSRPKAEPKRFSPYAFVTAAAPKKPKNADNDGGGSHSNNDGDGGDVVDASTTKPPPIPTSVRPTLKQSTPEWISHRSLVLNQTEARPRPREPAESQPQPQPQ